MAKEMGLDRAPIEFQPFNFSHVLVVPPIIHSVRPSLMQVQSCQGSKKSLNSTSAEKPTESYMPLYACLIYTFQLSHIYIPISFISNIQCSMHAPIAPKNSIHEINSLGDNHLNNFLWLLRLQACFLMDWPLKYDHPDRPAY